MVRRVFALVLLLVPSAYAGTRQPRFEPTDLDLAQAGVVDLDVEMGVVRDGEAWRAFVPDVELVLGLSESVSLQIDGAVMMASASTDDARPSRLLLDNTWVTLKARFVDVRDGEDRSWSLGVQAGPRLPTAAGASGVGFGALALLGRHLRSANFVLNLGTFIDPAQAGLPTLAGATAGLDVSVDLDRSGRISLTAELFGAHYWSGGAGDVGATVGVTLAASEWVDLSLVAIGGWLSGGWGAGGFLGFSPRFRLWRAR
jgi:hypothetical protein